MDIDYSSIIFIMGYFFNLLANWYLIYTVNKDKHIEGLSFQTQIIYGIATLSKCFYFQLTTLSDYMIGWIELLLSLATSAYLIYLFMKYRKFSFSPEKNFTFSYIAIPACIVLSIFVHPGFIEEGFDFASMMIACSSFLEAVAFVPQLSIMKKDGHVKKSFGIYIVLICISRLLRVLFWIVLYALEGGYFWTIILSDMIYVLMVADLVYYFYKHRNEAIIPFTDQV